MKEDLWKIYGANKEWIKFADTKAIAFIAIIGVIFNIFFSIKDEIIKLNNFNIVKMFYFASIVLLSLSLLFSIYCLIPRTSKTEDEKFNVIYFKGITDNFKNQNEYCDAIKKIDDFEEKVCGQNYQLANVATEKYSIVKWSLILFALGFSILLMFIICLIMGWSFNVSI